MTQELLAVIYSPSEHADNYIVFIDDENEFLQWKEQPEGQKSIALARFIGNFNIVSDSGVHIVSHGLSGLLMLLTLITLELSC